MPHLASMKTKDGRLSYVAAGNPSLPSLVFLHGIGGAARAWHGQLDFFKHRYRTIAWDMPLALLPLLMPCRISCNWSAR